MVVGRQCVALMMVQAVAVRSDTRHENVPAHVTFKKLGGRFNLCAGAAPLPIVGVVVHGVIPCAANRLLDARRVIPVGHQVAHALAEGVFRPAVHHGNLVVLAQQFRNQQAADEARPANQQHAQRWGCIACSIVSSRSIRARDE